MSQLRSFGRLSLVVMAILTAAGLAAAGPVVKLSGEGFVELSTDGPSSFQLRGNGSHLGTFLCSGEVDLVPGAEAGSLEGEGVAVIEAANGDLIVGVVTWEIDADGNGQMAFSWRDAIELSDGTAVSSTGRFARSRPAGAASRFTSISDGTSNIIAILIG